MKKLFLLLLVFVTAFNLAGGYAIAATFGRIQLAIYPVTQHKILISEKQNNYLQNQPQLFKEEKQDDDLVKCDLTFSSALPTVLSFIPQFSERNKHFLVHYATAIKAELPAAFLLGQVFRL